MSNASNHPQEYKRNQDERKKKEAQLKRMDELEARRFTQIEHEKRKKERALKMMQNMEEAKVDNPEQKVADLIE